MLVSSGVSSFVMSARVAMVVFFWLVFFGFGAGFLLREGFFDFG